MPAIPVVENYEDWQTPNYSFCPKCGGRLGHQFLKASEPARLVCRACGFVFFLDPKVAVGTIIPFADRILLVRRSIEPGYGKWVFPGGFVDRGEPLEEAAIRETREESRVDVRIKHLLNIYSYPNHPVIIVVYVGEPIGGHVSAGDETLEAETFRPQDIPWQHLAFPSTAQALRDFLALSPSMRCVP